MQNLKLRANLVRSASFRYKTKAKKTKIATKKKLTENVNQNCFWTLSLYAVNTSRIVVVDIIFPEYTFTIAKACNSRTFTVIYEIMLGHWASIGLHVES